MTQTEFGKLTKFWTTVFLRICRNFKFSVAFVFLKLKENRFWAYLITRPGLLDSRMLAGLNGVLTISWRNEILKIRFIVEIASSRSSQQSPGFIMTHRGFNEGVTRSWWLMYLRMKWREAPWNHIWKSPSCLDFEKTNVVERTSGLQNFRIDTTNVHPLHHGELSTVMF